MRMDRGMGKDNGDRSPTIFGLKVALPKADILNSYGKLICVNNKEIASVYFFRISVSGVSWTSWGYKILGRHDWS